MQLKVFNPQFLNRWSLKHENQISCNLQNSMHLPNLFLTVLHFLSDRTQPVLWFSAPQARGGCAGYTLPTRGCSGRVSSPQRVSVHPGTTLSSPPLTTSCCPHSFCDFFHPKLSLPEPNSFFFFSRNILPFSAGAWKSADTGTPTSVGQVHRTHTTANYASNATNMRAQTVGKTVVSSG